MNQLERIENNLDKIRQAIDDHSARLAGLEERCRHLATREDVARIARNGGNLAIKIIAALGTAVAAVLAALAYYNV